MAKGEPWHLHADSVSEASLPGRNLMPLAVDGVFHHAVDEKVVTETPLLKLYKFTNLEDFYRVYKPRTNCL